MTVTMLQPYTGKVPGDKPAEAEELACQIARQRARKRPAARPPGMEIRSRPAEVFGDRSACR